MPHGIDVDVTNLAVGDHLALTDLVLPEGVIITALQHEDVEAHNQTVCSVSEPKVVEEVEEEVVEDAESEEGGEESAEGSEDSNDGGEEE